MGVVAALLVLVAGDQAAQSAPLPSVQSMLIMPPGLPRRTTGLALDGYAALEKRLGPNGKPGSVGLGPVRKGEILYRLSRFEEAEAELRAGVRGLIS